MHLSRSTGDVALDACDAAEIDISVSTGDVHGTLLSPKIFSASADTGSVRVPQSGEGGSCTIHTTTGDIHISIS